MTWADIDFENQQINVRAQKETAKTFEWEPKDHENRVVPMSDGTAQLLADLHVLAPEGHPYVFIPSERLKRIKRRQKNGDWTPRSELINNLIRDFDVIRRRAGVKKCTLHDLRRAAITNWANQFPIQVVKQLAGHSCITTTSKYYLPVYPYPLSRQKTGIFKVDLSPSVKAVGTEGARRATAVPTATPYTSAGVL